MSKYDIKLKIKVIKEYNEKNNISQSELSKKYKIPQTTISNWIKWYIDNGIKGVSKKVKIKFILVILSCLYYNTEKLII